MRYKYELEDAGIDKKYLLNKFYVDDISDEVTMDELAEFELNTCDRCNIIENTEELIWITAEGFEPEYPEVVPLYLYKKYDALCQHCYSVKIILNGEMKVE